MKFHFQQISDYGTKNPIVARLCLQVKDIIRFFPLNETQKENVFGIMCMYVMPRIMTCYKINEEIGGEIIKCKEKINEDGIPTQSQEGTLTLPSILNLNERVETFLYSSKSALRDFIKIFNVIFNANLEKKQDMILCINGQKVSSERTITLLKFLSKITICGYSK